MAVIIKISMMTIKPMGKRLQGDTGGPHWPIPRIKPCQNRKFRHVITCRWFSVFYSGIFL